MPSPSSSRKIKIRNSSANVTATGYCTGWSVFHAYELINSGTRGISFQISKKCKNLVVQFGPQYSKFENNNVRL
jgi:hypothetical protein